MVLNVDRPTAFIHGLGAAMNAAVNEASTPLYL